MANTKEATWNDWMGADVIGSDGDKIGSLDNVYADSSGTHPAWLGVKTGFLGMRESLVPIEGVEGDGENLRVPVTKDQVKDAPSVDPESGELDRDDESELHRHYGSSASAGAGATSTAQGTKDTSRDTEAAQRTERDDVDTKASGADGTMTRSEEELAVGTRQTEGGRVRLHKYVETENVTTTVPVRKEVLRVEREAIEGDAEGTIGEDGAVEEIVLNQEEVVVDKRVVAKEKVSLSKDVETEEREVSDEVRKERIEVDDDTSKR